MEEYPRRVIFLMCNEAVKIFICVVLMHNIIEYRKKSYYLLSNEIISCIEKQKVKELPCFGILCAMG